MLTVLEVIRYKPFFHSVLCPYRISGKVLSKEELTVLHIQYHLWHGKVDFRKLYALTLGYDTTILCSENLVLPSPFRRFHSDTLTIQLMQNFVLSVIDKLPFSPVICYIDKSADFPEFIRKCSASIHVITDMPRFYENLSRTLPNITVSNSFDDMGQPDIILSVSPPDGIPENHALVFTYQKPNVSLSDTVFYQYEFPVLFSEIKPDCISNEYFLSALYDLCDVHELQNIIPRVCMDGIQYYTADYLAHLIQKTSANI